MGMSRSRRLDDRHRGVRAGRLACAVSLAIGWWWAGSTVSAGTIDTSILEQPWPGEWVRESEVHKYTVRWRQRLDKKEGLFVGIRFTAPTDRQTTWAMATDFSDIGSTMPNVTAVRYLEKSPTRQVIQIDAKILWKTIQLNFEIEKDAPDALRFRLVNEFLGDYRALVSFKDPTPAFHSSEPANTLVEMMTWLQPARPVPLRLLAAVERMMFLRAAKEFLLACEQEYLKTAEHVPPAGPKTNF